MIWETYIGVSLITASQFGLIGSERYPGHSFNDTPHYQLYDYLLTGYNTKLRPRFNVSHPVSVGLEFELNTVNQLDEVNQVMKTVGFVVAAWYDDFLCWNDSDYHVDHLVLPANYVWVPDLGVKNSADTFYDQSYTRDFRVDIRHDGRILWAFGGIFETTCVLDMTYYPFDRQMCEIDIENWAYTSDAVDLYSLLDEVHLAEFTENGEWQYDYSKVEVEYFHEDTHPDKDFPRVRFEIFLTRKFNYFMINIICPALFVIVIALTVFWLPPESGEKVSLGITVLLAFSVFQLVILDNTPRTSDFTPVMTMMFTIIMGMATFSVIASIIVLYYHHTATLHRPNKLIRYLAFKVFARLMFMHKYEPDDSQISPDVSTADDPHQNQTGNTEDITDILEDLDFNTIKAKLPVTPEKRTVHDDVREILQHLRGMRARVQEREKTDIVIAEWRAAARVLDRAFFWVAFVVVTVAVPVILSKRDDSHEHSN